MNLGEQIYKLRTEKNLSQVDLADLLDVSRQSISKWETNSSVPELDKLIKLSEIFGVSLDELILDKKQSAEPEEKEISQESEIVQPGKRQRIVGFTLLCAAGLVWLTFSFSNLIYYIPLAATVCAICGLICLRVRKFVKLYCIWSVILLADAFLLAVQNANILGTSKPLGNKEAILATCLSTETWMLIFVGLMVVVSFCALYKVYPCSMRKDGIYAGIFWAVYYLMRLPYVLLMIGRIKLSPKLYQIFVQLYEVYGQGGFQFMFILGKLWQHVLLAFAVVSTARLLVALWCKYKNKKSAGRLT